MYYIVETLYVGPNAGEEGYEDLDKVEIRRSPARTNSSHEERVKGWCGTSNDFSRYAHGEYATMEAAQEELPTLFGALRSHDEHGQRFAPDDDDVVAVYRKGQYIPMGIESTKDWIWQDVIKDVTVDTTNVQLAKLAESYEANANRDGYTLNGATVKDYMRHYQEALIEETGMIDAG